MKPSKKNFNAAKLLHLGITEKERANLIKKYESFPRSVGQKYAIAHLNGEKLTSKQKAQGECFACSGGTKDCRAVTCSFHKGSDYTDKSYSDPERIQTTIKYCENNTVSSAGNSLYLRYLKGEKLTHSQINLARCAECRNFYIDGRKDCCNSLCTLYSSMPYRGKM